MQTTYITQGFTWVNKKQGKQTVKVLEVSATFQYNKAQDAIDRAGRLAERMDGAVAVAQEFSEDEIGDFELLFHAGDVPAQLLGLDE